MSADLPLRWASVTALSIALALAISASSVAGDFKNGAYVFKAAGCTGCHTREDDRKKEIYLAGGRAFKTPFGTYFSPNITPDKSGIGTWNESDFKSALRHGITPDGDNYFPVFPYLSYTKMSDEDISDLWTYMKSVASIKRENRDHDVNFIFSSRFLITFWKLLFFSEGVLQPNQKQPPDWNRGRYLVDAVGHCGECHTPRNFLGAWKSDMYLAGTTSGPDGKSVPNITPDLKTGINGWKFDDFDSLLSMGMLPDGDFVGASMGEVVENTEGLIDSDRNAISTYLQSIPAISHKVTSLPPK